jgi:hypothetical protein
LIIAHGVKIIYMGFGYKDFHKYFPGDIWGGWVIVGEGL